MIQTQRKNRRYYRINCNSTSRYEPIHHPRFANVEVFRTCSVHLGRAQWPLLEALIKFLSRSQKSWRYEKSRISSKARFLTHAIETYRPRSTKSRSVSERKPSCTSKKWTTISASFTKRWTILQTSTDLRLQTLQSPMECTTTTIIVVRLTSPSSVGLL